MRCLRKLILASRGVKPRALYGKSPHCRTAGQRIVFPPFLPYRDYELMLWGVVPAGSIFACGPFSIRLTERNVNQFVRFVHFPISCHAILGRVTNLLVCALEYTTNLPQMGICSIFSPSILLERSDIMYLPNPDRYTQMSYQACGSSGLQLPLVSLGLWHNFGETSPYDTMEQLCLTAFDHGITHFDLANNYGPPPGRAEENFGRILKTQLQAHRDELIISTKAGYGMWPGPYGDGGSRKYLLSSLDQSLKRLGIPYVDIFYHHRMDPNTPLEETMGALAQAVHSGKALYVGLSNYDGVTMQRAAEILADLHCPLLINQNRYSLLDRTIEQNQLMTCALQQGSGLITFCSLEQGLLTNRYLNGIPADSRMSSNSPFLQPSTLTPQFLAQLNGLNEIATNRGQSLAQMSLAWILSHREITSVLIGASRPEQITENLKCLEHLQFSPIEQAQIEKVLFV